MHPLDWLLRKVLPLGLAAVAATLLLVGWTTEPNRLEVGFAPKQPIPFSHKVHAGTNKIQCLYCHSGATKSRYAGYPPVESCFNCHRAAKAGTDTIRELARIFENGTALEWKRVHRLPDHVYFDHRPHVNNGIDCTACHGDVKNMELLEQNMSMRMGNCLNCHRDVHGYIDDAEQLLGLAPDLVGAENCNACHR
ncbi:cytochrome c family protein [Oligoflexia bacterium]|nr:cytochrome c family protein [Oligoflexia bacterium]